MITEISDSLIKKYQEQGIREGLSTTPFTLQQAQPIIADLYTHILQRPVPAEIVIEPSPKAAWRRVCALTPGGDNMAFVWPALDGHWDSYYQAWVECLREAGVTGLDTPAYSALRASIVLDCIYPLDDVCVLSQMPTEIHRLGDVLHREDGPAVAYGDDLLVYSLHGVRVPAEVVMTKARNMDKEFLVRHMLRTENVEVKREILRKVGMERYVATLGAEVMDRMSVWVDNEHRVFRSNKGGKLREVPYELLRVDIGEDGLELRALKMKNPSVDLWHVENVPPTVETVMQALEFRNGGPGLPHTLS